MDKRVIIAVVISIIIIFFYPYFLNKYVNQPKAKAPVKAAQPTSSSAPAREAVGASLPAPEVSKEELTTVDTPLFRAVFTNVGGAIKSFELKKYKESIEKNSPTVNLAGKVYRGAAFKTLIDTNGTKEDVFFKPSASNIAITDNQSAELLFVGTTREGVRVEKKLVFTANSYIIGAETVLSNGAQSAFNGKADTLLTAGFAGKDKTNYHVGPLIYTKNKLFRESLKDHQPSGDGTLKWLGLEDKYFLSVVIPRAPAGSFSWTSNVPNDAESDVTLEFPVSLAPGARAAFSYNIFSGPKEYDLLVKQGSGLEEAIQFGIFSFMAKPFLVVLNFFERYIGNYGIAIILLTVIIKVIFYPLTKHSLTSMRKMQQMQPQMAALKEKYKDDKEKMNRELMELYKRHKINPVSGCLPMVLQIPVFIALYEVLYVSIDLRHAPFFLWIRDLSDKDPYYISPLLMGATMFAQQKMTPTSADPTQAKVMLFMPIVFTYMFLKFPSGLVVYWLVNNLLQIAQQYYIQRAPAKS